jgi:hypothetical protein
VFSGLLFAEIRKAFHRTVAIRGGTIGGDLYLIYLFVSPSRVEVSFSSFPEVPSFLEGVNKQAPLETRNV